MVCPPADAGLHRRSTRTTEVNGEGLLQATGLEKPAGRTREADRGTRRRRKIAGLVDRLVGAVSSDPRGAEEAAVLGGWVIYFSLAALPLFGLGEALIPAEETGRRQYAFWLMSLYVGCGLGLLLTTCFLGLRRYLRQRRLQMPAAMTGVWLTAGGGLIARAAGGRRPVAASATGILAVYVPVRRVRQTVGVELRQAGRQFRPGRGHDASATRRRTRATVGSRQGRPGDRHATRASRSRTRTRATPAGAKGQGRRRKGAKGQGQGRCSGPCQGQRPPRPRPKDQPGSRAARRTGRQPERTEPDQVRPDRNRPNPSRLRGASRFVVGLDLGAGRSSRRC